MLYRLTGPLGDRPYGDQEERQHLLRCDWLAAFVKPRVTSPNGIRHWATLLVFPSNDGTVLWRGTRSSSSLCHAVCPTFFSFVSTSDAPPSIACSSIAVGSNTVAATAISLPAPRRPLGAENRNRGASSCMFSGHDRSVLQQRTNIKQTACIIVDPGHVQSHPCYQSSNALPRPMPINFTAARHAPLQGLS